MSLGLSIIYKLGISLRKAKNGIKVCLLKKRLSLHKIRNSTLRDSPEM